MTKVDLKKTLDSYRASVGTFRQLDVPEMRYLMIDGHGDPNVTPAYAEAIAALYPVAYAMKFASKVDLDRDYVVPPLEGLWWADDMAVFTTARDKSQWNWTLMLLVPEWVEDTMFRAAVDKVRATKSPPRLEDLRVERLHEGTCLQTLHVGAFDDEAEVLAHLHEHVIPGEGLTMTGKHHEIYLSDFRRVAPERRRTVLRQPVTRRSSH